MKKWILVIGLFVIIVVGAVVLVELPSPNTASAPTTPPSTITNLITVTTPLPNSTISSPLSISGQARGNWFFEATAPVILQNSDGTVLAQGTISTQSDWTTVNFVPFTASLTFSPQPAGSHGMLILRNDNPSGDPSNQKELDIPVTF